MAVCTFFGHRECPNTIQKNLRQILTHLINHCDVQVYYVGNQGQFDALVRTTLRELEKEYPQIQYAVVLSYMPTSKQEHEDYSDTMLPEGIEQVHPRYAISWRNDWMLKQSDYVITHITHNWGGAAKYAEKAKRQGKTVINIQI